MHVFKPTTLSVDVKKFWILAKVFQYSNTLKLLIDLPLVSVIVDLTLLGLFQTSCYCRAKLAQHTSTTWFQTSNLIQLLPKTKHKNKETV